MSDFIPVVSREGRSTLYLTPLVQKAMPLTDVLEPEASNTGYLDPLRNEPLKIWTAQLRERRHPS